MIKHFVRRQPPGCWRLHQAWAHATPLALATCLLLAPSGLHAGLIHRWSFNHPAGAAPAGTTLTDSIGGAHGAVVGNGATNNGTAIVLPGTTSGNVAPASISAYVDLPNGLINGRSTFTFEVWATVISAKNWQRLVNFGRMNIAGQGTGAAPGEIKPNASTAPDSTSSSDVVLLCVTRDTTPNTQRAEGRMDGPTLSVDTTRTINFGTEYHFVIVVEDGAGAFGASGSQLRWYLNGALAGTQDFSFRLTHIEDVNNWLGRSQFSNDSLANIAYNEFRIYHHALTPAEITNSMNAGPNATFGPPVTQPDSATLHHGHKVRVPVLANDTGEINPATVVLVTPPSFGTATPDAAGRILYAHTTGTPAADAFTYQVSGPGGASTPATVTLHFTNAVRIMNPTLNVPANPPPTAYQLSNAFPSLTFSQPLCLRTPPGETNRLFVCEKTGLLRVITNLTTATAAPTFLNLPALMTSRGWTFNTTSEQGLLGLAFHPGYATNGHFFVFYSPATNNVKYNRLSRFTVQPGNPNAADPNSELILFSQLDPADNHNGGDLHFGPDGYLYVSLGDGGGGNDQYDKAQRLDLDLFAGILRLDVDRRPGNLEPNAHPAINLTNGIACYAIPSDNPFIGATSFIGSPVNPSEVRTEYYAVGLRNPWRFSFDYATSNLWCADVGQSAREEVNLITSGGNYGWAFREGTINGAKAGLAPANFDALYHTPPIYEYLRGTGEFQGNSTTGGHVYRGNRISALHGAYIFGDYVAGNIWALRQTNSTVSVERITGLANTVAFGTDPANGDVLVCDIANGRIMRLTADTPSGAYPQTLTDTGVFADLADLSPSPGVLPYDPNLPFWSDHALKRRWFAIPDATNTMTWSRDGLWTFPTNQFWVKHFDLELERGHPATKRRLETRLLVRSGSGVYGVSYQWNAAQTEATLVADAGADFALIITNAGVIQTQQWRIPSRAECLACHTPQGGHALSFTTRQLNRAANLGNQTGNQLELLHAAGYFANPPEPANTLPRHVAADDTTVPLETRVRSYLDVNCVSCHQPGGTGGGTWDARATTPLSLTGLINGSANNNGGDPASKLIVPGDPLHSVLLHRAAASNGFTRMPPLGTSELDAASIALLTEWIQNYDTNRLSFAEWQVLHFGSTNHPNALATADPDLDGRRNELEYLLGTPPLTANPAPDLTLEVSAGIATVEFPLSPNAVAQVLTSTNLLNWSLWNVPGNDAVPQVSSPQLITGPATNPPAFFRLQLNER